MKIGIIGTGISGLSAALCLADTHEVVLINDEARAGGHAHTRPLDLPEGKINVDTGFIVFNRPNYPNFSRLLAHLGVEVARSDMTFAVSVENGGLEFKGGYGLRALFAQRRNLLRPRFYRLLRAIVRFHAVANRALTSAATLPDTLQQFLRLNGFDRTDLARDYLYPMMAAIWSGRSAAMGAMPLRTFLNFFKNHGLLSINGKPQWETVRGGSQTYVQALLNSLNVERRFGSKVTMIERDEAGVKVHLADGSADRFDEVILATHSDQSLQLLGNGATAQERAVLSAIPYAPNTAYLHRDTALMPQRRQAWASWSYLGAPSATQCAQDRPVALTYWMNNLQPLATQTPVLLTLNPDTPPDPALTFDSWVCDHPQFTPDGRQAQLNLPDIQGRKRVWFAGAWAGYGFHEDGCQAGIAIAQALGGTLPWAQNYANVSPAADCVRADALATRMAEQAGMTAYRVAAE